MTRHYPDLCSSSDWSKQISRAARPPRNNTQIWIVTRHQYGISTLVSQTSFRGETSGGVTKFPLFSQASTCKSLATLRCVSLRDFILLFRQASPSLLYGSSRPRVGTTDSGGSREGVRGAGHPPPKKSFLDTGPPLISRSGFGKHPKKNQQHSDITGL